MDIRQEFREETDMDVYASYGNNGSFNNVYVKWLEAKLTLTDVVVPKGTCCLKPKKIGKVNDMFESWDECKNCGKEVL
jgi:hypothetical protein